MGDGSLLYRGGIDMRASKEMGTQTDTHVVSSFIDKQYEWNEWALRRRALLLVRKLPHSHVITPQYTYCAAETGVDLKCCLRPTC